jgi:hypothetical protein
MHSVIAISAFPLELNHTEMVSHMHYPLIEDALRIFAQYSGLIIL